MKGFLSDLGSWRDLAIWGMLQGYVQIILEGILRMVLRNDGVTFEKVKKSWFQLPHEKILSNGVYFFHHKLSLSFIIPLSLGFALVVSQISPFCSRLRRTSPDPAGVPLGTRPAQRRGRERGRA